MPVEGAVSPRALVTNPRAGTVSVIDTATQRVTATIPIYRPTKVAFSPDGITAYVISEKGLAVIDANSLQIAAVIPLSAYSTELALSPDGSTVYVILTDRQKVEVIDTSILEVTDTIPVGADPKRGAFSPDGATVFVTDFDNDIVSVIDTVSRKVTGTIPVGHRTNDIAFSSDGTTAYVTCYYDHVVSVIDARTRRVTTSIPFAGDSNSVLGSLAFSPDGSLYVTSTNTLSVIDTTCHKITATIPVGPVNGLFLWSTYLAFTPNGKTAYLTEQEADRVLVIDTATLRVTGTINAGPAPYRVAIAAVPTVAQSITSLNVFPNPALARQPVRLTATVTSESAGSAEPTGAVAFNMNGEHLGVGRLSRGAATFTTIPESAGDRVLTATYVGHGDCGYSYSAPVRLTITSCPSATTLTAEPKSVVVGNAVRLTANVSSVGAGPGGPNGTVEFHADGSLVGAGELYNGSAVFTIRSLGAGEHQITATYLGNTIYGRSVSSPVIVSVTSSAVSVTAVPNSALIGEAVTLTAHVTCAAGVPTGTVRFMNEGIPLGTAPLSADGTARFVTSALGAADHQITATYLGNDVCTQATSPPVRLTVTKGTSTTSVTAFPTAAHPSRPVTLTAQVACNTGAPTGTVDFLDSARRIGTGLITDGTTQLITTDLAVGTHQISASYSGDARCGPSTSPPITVTIFVYGSRG